METIEITKTNKDFEVFKYVIKALSKDATRYAINHLKIDGSQIVGVDGRRLHIGDITGDYVSGLYEVKTNNAKSIFLVLNDGAGNFPKYQDIVPNHKACYEINSEYGINAIMSILGKHDITVNYRFVDDACFAGENAKVYYGEPDRPILIVYPLVKSVVMPINISEGIKHFPAADDADLEL